MQYRGGDNYYCNNILININYLLLFGQSGETY